MKITNSGYPSSMHASTSRTPPAGTPERWPECDYPSRKYYGPVSISETSWKRVVSLNLPRDKSRQF